MRRFTALLGLLLSLLALPAMAEVRVTFYSHAWNAGGDGMFPHAFIRATGQPEWAPQGIDENFGFTAGQSSIVVLKARGWVQGADAAYVSRSVPHFWIELTDEQYRALLARIDTWTRPPGSDYNLYRRNCISFVADLARHLGLTVGNTKTLKPEVFLSELTQLNAGRIMPGLAPPAPPAPQVSAAAEPALAQ